jgi:hypothetical protein
VTKISKYLAWMVPFVIGTGVGAAVLTPVPPVPGSVANSTAVLGISDNGYIAGDYKGADLSLHGFVTHHGGPYTTFDAGSGGTGPRAVNTKGQITGYSGANACNPHMDCVEFERASGGAITPVTQSGVQLYGTVQGILSNGNFVGDYHPSGSPTNQTNGFYGANGQYTSDLTLPFATRETEPRALNISGEVDGWYVIPGDIARGFVLQGGTVTTVNYPDPSETNTNLEGLNDAGWIAGQWNDTLGNSHGFVLSPDLLTFTDIIVPGATQVQAWAINNNNEVAVSTDIGSFIYCMNGAVGYCHGGGGHAVVSSVRRASSGSLHAVQCLNGCRFHGGTPSAFYSPVGGREPASVRSSARSKRATP